MAFENRTVLVTGASIGIGRSIAAAFVMQGARVMACGRSEARLRETEALLSPAAGGRLASFVADVRCKAEVESLVMETTRRFGPIDILVNNAGVYPNTKVVDMPEEEWDTVVDTNLQGPFLVSQAVARQMIARGQGGKIVNITSTAARSARPGASHYAASKAALAMFTQVLALELAEHHINVNAVAPGFIDVGPHAPITAQYREAILKTVPRGRAGRPEDVAQAVLFLASEDADYITGDTILVDGGMLAGRYTLPLSK